MTRLIGLLLICIGFSACNSCKTNKVEESDTDDIRRYEVDLFNIDTNNFEAGIAEIYPRYKVFLGSQLPDENGMRQLKNFVTDPLIRSTYEYTMRVFPDVNSLKTGFNAAFARMQQGIPEIQQPQLYTYVSGFDVQMPIKYADSALIIGLDLYLGKDFKPYLEQGFPIYIINRLSPEYILPDAFKEIAWARLPATPASTLLDAMIEQGKTIYFAEVMLPDTRAEYLMKYTAEQINWVEANEQSLWSFMIENQLLYSTDASAITMFMTEGPFTSGFSNESPSRTGHWLGWQIVKNYMAKNDVTLKQMLEDTDSQKILQQSGYKPARI
jgi:hypothetical protein